MKTQKEKEMMKLKKYKEQVEKRLGWKVSEGPGERTCYIYGTGMMGKFVYDQLKDRYQIAGFLDRAGAAVKSDNGAWGGV